MSFLILASLIKLSFWKVNNQFFIKQTQEAQVILNDVLAYKTQTQWLFTDLPMYGVQAQINVPPELAMISRKRIASGQATPDSTFAMIKKYQPEQFILGRFPELKQPIQTYLDQNFERRSPD